MSSVNPFLRIGRLNKTTRLVRALDRQLVAVASVIHDFWTGEEQFYRGQAVRVDETDNSRGGVGHVVCDMGDTVEVRLEGDLEVIEVGQERVHAI